MALRTLSLCAGFGGLDLGLELAFGTLRPIAYVEREVSAARILAARIADGFLAPAPIWSDLARFDGKPLAGMVDLLCGGFPCQDISIAGRGEGIVEGNRSGLWFEFARIIRECRPRLVAIENVSAILIRGIDTVLGDLAALGYDTEWLCLRASDVGASHRRERWFCLAYRQGARSSCRISGRRRDDVANTIGGSSRQRWSAGPGEEGGRRAHAGPSGSSLDMGDTLGEGLEVGRCVGRDIREERAATERTGLPLFAPGPSDPIWPDLLVRHSELRPAISQAEAESILRRMADGHPDWMVPGRRTAALRALGNGCVPLQVAAAFVELAGRLRE